MIIQRTILDPVTGVCLLVGDGAPTNVNAPVGSLFVRRDGAESTTLYSKFGTTNADWSALEASTGGVDWASVSGKPAGLVSSSVQINTGSFTGSFTGSLLGTGSWALSASVARSASFAPSPSGTITSSVFSAPSQGTVRTIINGVTTDVDTGLQTTDSPSFTGLTVDTTVLVVDSTNNRVTMGGTNGGYGVSLSNQSALNTGSVYIGASLNGSGRGVVIDGNTRTSTEGSTLLLDVTSRTGVAGAFGVTVDGRVGIGVASQSISNQLQVNGNVSASAFTGSSGIVLGTIQGGIGVSGVATLPKRIAVGGTYNSASVTSNVVGVWIGDYDNDGTVVYPYYAEDENNLVDFFIKNRDLVSGSSSVGYFGGQVHIGTSTASLAKNVLDLGAATNNRGISWGGVTNNYANIWTQYSSADLNIAVGLTPSGSSTGSLHSSYGSAMGRAMVKLGSFGTAAGTIGFFTSGTFTAATDTLVSMPERMRITATGQVGIGTTSPQAQLHVVGTVSASSAVYATDFVLA